MKVFNSLLVEDEQLAANNLLSCLGEIRFVNNVGHYKDLEKAKEAILYHKPSILFLDIEINREPIFNLLEKLDDWDLKFGIIFHTAYYEKYILDAIRTVGLKYKFAYLSKPLDSARLIQTINDLRKSLLKDAGEYEKNSILFSSQSGSIRLLFDEILCCETDGAGAKIYLTNEKKIHISKNLKQLIKILPRKHFFRMSGQYIINKQYFRKTHIAGSGEARKYSCTLQVGLYEKTLPIPPKQWKSFNDEIKNDPFI